MRAEAHAAAWTAAGLTAVAVKDLTAAWRGDAVDSPDPALVDCDAVSESGMITPRGTSLRDSIEAETNQRSELSYGALDTNGLAVWIAELAELPPSF